MIFFVTLVASDSPLSAGHIAKASGLLEKAGRMAAGDPAWLDPHKAADIPVEDRPSSELIREFRRAFAADKIDVFVTPKGNRRKKLLLADMDSTIVEGETLDEIAAYAGIKDQIAVITARAMNGEIDFKTALRERVALLRGVPEEALRATLFKTKLNPGADSLIVSVKQYGALCVLVSGGFTFFTEAFAKQAGFDRHHGNTLGIENGKLTGEVLEPILDKDAKLSYLKHYTVEQGLEPHETLALGDGANDLPMLLAAGLGIGYRPKPIVEESLDNCIIHGDLTAALYAQGFRMGPGQ